MASPSSRRRALVSLLVFASFLANAAGEAVRGFLCFDRSMRVFRFLMKWKVWRLIDRSMRVVACRVCSGGLAHELVVVVRVGGGADAAEGSSQRAEVLHRRLEHQRQALPRLGRVQRGAGVRCRRGLVRLPRSRRVRRLLLSLLLLRRRRRQRQRRLLLLPRRLRRLPRAPPRLHCRRHNRVHRAVRRAGEVPREHDGDAAVRREPVRRSGGEPARVHRVPRDGEGGRRGEGHPPRRPPGEGRRRRAQGGRVRRRARRAHDQQLAQHPHRVGDNKDNSHRCCRRDAGLGVSWACVLPVRAQISSVHPSDFWMDPGYCNIHTVRHFPPLAQRGGRHVRRHGRMGAPPARPHGARRHPPLRRRGGDVGGASPEQGGQLPDRLRAQQPRRHRRQRQRPGVVAAVAAGQLPPVRPSRAAPLQPLQPRPHRPRLRRRRGRRRRRAAGVAGLRVPRHDGGGGGAVVGGVRDHRPPHSHDVRPDGRRRQRQRRAAPVRPRPRRPRRLLVRASRVPGGDEDALPRAAAAQRQGVPGAARRVRRRGGGRGRVGGPLPGAAAAERDEAVPGVAVQVPHRGEVAAQEPPAAVPARRQRQVGEVETSPWMGTVSNTLNAATHVEQFRMCLVF